MLGNKKVTKASQLSDMGQARTNKKEAAGQKKKPLFWERCGQYGISLWQCPYFLFIVMGVITIGAMLFAFFITRTGSAELIIYTAFIITLVFFIPGTIIIKSFEHMAEANRMKSEFVSIASHQLRSPLTAIRWSTELLIKERVGKLSEKQKQYIILLKENNDRMIILVNDLLNVSRIDKGDLKLKNKEIDTKSFVEKIFNSIKPTAQSHNVILQFKSEDDMPPVLGDETYFGMVVTNFIDNAIKYSKDGGGRVVVRLIKKGQYIRYEVEDNGIGISKEDQKFIFNKFFRTSVAEQKQSDGTGLGLFIAKSVIKKMDGKIGFYSKEGEGTTFWFEVPIIKN